VFRSLLVANRGEIAVRILRCCRELGIESVAVYSDADADMPHVRLADRAVRLGPAAPAESYLDARRLLEAAGSSGAEAIHPGYGFLAENAAFARAVRAAGLAFVGPTPEAIEAMGDKMAARRTAAANGIPIVPGSEPESRLDALAAQAYGIGFPILVKAAGGGGGRGMRRVEEPSQLGAALAAASREAEAAFGDGRVYLERALDRPRHVEVQVLADRHGNALHLFERECSLQRRFQKIVEEAPAPNLEPATRTALTDAAVRLARAVEYEGAGSVEYLLHDGHWYFLEMNTRLQVEHPVTEMICGVDLVRAQIEIAAGLPLAFRQEDLEIQGSAIEARVCAEDPSRGFVPSPGLLAEFSLPAGPGIRCDAGVVTGSRIPPEYDAMIAKVIAHDHDREAALARLRRALEETAVVGVASNLGHLLDLLEDDEVRAGRLDTQLVQRKLDAAAASSSEGLPPELVAVALFAARRLAPAPAGDGSEAPTPSPWTSLPGWRGGGVRS